LGTHRIHVAESEAGRRLDQVLAEIPDVVSRSLAERLIADGAVRVGGVARPKSHRLETGDVIDVELPDLGPMQAEDIALVVPYEDEHLLVVEKPAGLVVHPVGRRETGTLAHGLLSLGAEGGDDDRPGIVHRLDRDTSGLLVVARSEEAHEALEGMIRRREVERRYLALVRGRPRSRTGRIEAPIGRDRRDRARHSLDTETPRDAVTWFELRESLVGRSLLEVRLETGRTHQIRVHLDSIGLPVCGDPTYGVADDLGLARQFLHAYSLTFVHPFTEAEVAVESALPPDLAAALDAARAETVG
jgi:23S rRNA pseudouridine1911/1915/1917 synthase